MRIACIGDVHLINPEDPNQEQRAARSFFIDGQASLRRLLQTINNSDIDHVIFLGDLVDWASRENIAYARAFIKELQCACHVLPGNHDFQGTVDGLRGRELRQLWQEVGIDMTNTAIDCGCFSLILLDNSIGTLEAETVPWLREQLARHPWNVVCQHVPLDLPEIRDCIRKAAPGRNFNKYVLSSYPSLFADCYQGRVQLTLNGHVHMQGAVMTEGCEHRLCQVGIDLYDPGREETARASATLFTFNGSGFDCSIMYAD